MQLLDPGQGAESWSSPWSEQRAPAADHLRHAQAVNVCDLYVSSDAQELAREVGPVVVVPYRGHIESKRKKAKANKISFVCASTFSQRLCLGRVDN